MVNYVMIKPIDGNKKKKCLNLRILKVPNNRYEIRDIEGCQISRLAYDGVLEARNIKIWIGNED